MKDIVRCACYMQITNNYIFSGKPELKAEGAKVTKPSKSIPKIGAPAKAADPKKDEDDDSDDESDDDLAGEDEFGSSDEVF